MRKEKTVAKLNIHIKDVIEIVERININNFLENIYQKSAYELFALKFQILKH